MAFFYYLRDREVRGKVKKHKQITSANIVVNMWMRRKVALENRIGVHGVDFLAKSDILHKDSRGSSKFQPSG